MARDPLAERRKRAQRKEAQAVMAAEASRRMAEDLEGVRAAGWAEGFQAGIIEAHRLAQASGSLWKLRDKLASMRAQPKKKERAS